MERFEHEVKFLGFQRKNYPGSFSIEVEKIIKSIIKSPCLHLFSGKSKLGDERIDFSSKEATKNMDVFEFIKQDNKNWKWCILDPPYNIDKPQQKLKGYSNITPVSASIPKRNALSEYFLKHVENILWLDLCAPLPEGFQRIKLWFLLPGSYRHVRVLSWLKRKIPLTKWTAVI
jgi:hypothetical protein